MCWQLGARYFTVESTDFFLPCGYLQSTVNSKQEMSFNNEMEESFVVRGER